MDPRLRALFERIRKSGDFEFVVFDDVNAATVSGDNALHWAARANDLGAATLLIEAGVNVNQHGELGRTPLHEACSWGHKDMVLLLVEHGADLYASTEGEVPFSLARLRGHDEICELLTPLMRQAQAADPNVWLRVRVAHLRREIRRLEQLLK
jgi:ankyrin repeat protein